MDTVNEHLKYIRAEAKMQTLGCAIENAECNSFTFIDNEHTDNESTGIVLGCLFHFRRKNGSRFSPDYCVDQRGEPGRKLFREKLSEQIWQLTGVKPRIVVETNGGCCIYYS